MLRRFTTKQPMYKGAVTPHEFNSYFPLAIVMLVVGFAVTAFTTTAQSPGPETGSIGLSGVMPGDPPKTAPTITSPVNSQRFSTSPITVKGSCPSGTLVEIFKNDIFAGSTFCEDSKYSIDIDLLFGKNDLVARVYDDLNQSSPPSSTMTVFYDVLGTQASGLTGLDFGGVQMLLNTDAVFRGIFPEKEMSIPVTILGGRAPFAINIQWGDSEHSLVPRNSNAVFTASHVYHKPGTYPISVQATDADGRVAFMTVAAIVNGQPDPTVAGSTSKEQTNTWISMWPLYTATAGIIFSFWLGERREKHVLTKHHQLISQV